MKQADPRTLYVRVDTFNQAGQQIGSRVVDMYHFGTKDWLITHSWWAMHNGHSVEQRTMAAIKSLEHQAA